MALSYDADAAIVLLFGNITQNASILKQKCERTIIPQMLCGNIPHISDSIEIATLQVFKFN